MRKVFNLMSLTLLLSSICLQVLPTKVGKTGAWWSLLHSPKYSAQLVIPAPFFIIAMDSENEPISTFRSVVDTMGG